MSRVEVGGVLAFAALIVVACGPARVPATGPAPADAAPAEAAPAEAAPSQAAPTPMLSWYRDADGDGQGDRRSTLTAIDPPSGYVRSGYDCNDADPAVHRGAIEIAGDGVDEDCDGTVDEVDVQTPIPPSPAPGR